MPAAPRRYRQVARAAATADIRHRSIDVFFALLRDRMLDEITLDEVAVGAGTTRQTVIRHFGGKDGLLRALAERLTDEINARRAVPAGAQIDRRMAALVADYDLVGDIVVRMQAQEPGSGILKEMLDSGRASHRAWVADTFADGLAGWPEADRARLCDQLYAATDVQVWKLLRRDFGHSAAATAALMTDMARKLLACPPRPEANTPKTGGDT
ncbi:TetR/AcrR family transcriptional regulator [Limobrevibacterium gyesilva]|uniref:TetR/AcrR family transcriptional regulator n=1 Tax=Limobrevibacterium gyesilva TaxID=2991712 RepID=A0AA41YUC8_9PROT|nr:helix-turn-helix domain-containing protein [Limobrevibacterium gyesilva]MCW3475587.1 TetR/AcrR family transcriptional regulator [Limobrevibacterium gyesilva]